MFIQPSFVRQRNWKESILKTEGNHPLIALKCWCLCLFLLCHIHLDQGSTTQLHFFFKPLCIMRCSFFLPFFLFYSLSLISVVFVSSKEIKRRETEITGVRRRVNWMKGERKEKERMCFAGLDHHDDDCNRIDFRIEAEKLREKDWKELCAHFPSSETLWQMHT